MGLQVITTVVDAADDYDLVDLATIKDELQLTDSRSDKFLERQISWASAAAANFCNRVFPAETVKDDIWPDRDWYPSQLSGGIAPLQLTRWPLIAVTSVVENDVTLVVDTDYSVDLKRGVLQRLDVNQYPKAWQPWKIEVTYSAGFEDIPADVIDAVVRMVKMRWFARLRDPMLRTESITGVRDVAYWVATGDDAGAMPPDVEGLLDNYRVPVTA